MRPWCAVQHVSWEGPGLIGAIARARGIDLQVRRMDLGDPLPEAGAVGGLVVMGGPMGANDDVAYPHLVAERKLLADVVGSGIPVLGVCLGSQLLAAALGAEVRRGASLEIGALDVRLTPEGSLDPVLGPAGPVVPVIQWHHDTFDLPPGAVHLAASDAYPRQAFRVGRHAYGIQFHPELDAALLRAWTPHFPDGVRIDELSHARVVRSCRGILERFFDRVAPAT